MFLTIFTPAYNRRYRLNALYESLCRQTDKDFEWVIVDDGSTDDTESLVNEFIEENKLDIVFHRQENGGKHRAINKGVSMARGKMFFIVDSDDFLPDNSVERIRYYSEQIMDDDRFGGICGLKCLFNGKIVGTDTSLLPNPLDCSSLEYRFKYKVRGDRAEVFKLSVLKDYPFPEIEGEKFCTEALVFNRIAKNYLLRYFPENIYFCEYLPDGLSASSVRIRANNPKAAVLYYKELIKNDIGLIQKLKTAINYFRFRFCLSDKDYLRDNQIGVIWFIMMPFGFIFYLRDKFISKV